MSLIPGGTRPDGAGFRYSLDDAALADSMALAIEREMANLYLGVNQQPLPATALSDMRLLFVAIARGVLGYLNQRQSGNITALADGLLAHTHEVKMDIAMNQP